MRNLVLFTIASGLSYICTAPTMAEPGADPPSRHVVTNGALRAATTEGGQSAGIPIIPEPPLPDPGGIVKNRFISFSNPEAGWTAIRVTFVSLHHVDPPYTAGPSVPFTQFEAQSQYVGPPTRYVESLSVGTPFYASALQCAPYYHNWSTIDVLHVTGEVVVPSSMYDVQILASDCLDHEDDCEVVSESLTIPTALWGDIIDSPENPDTGEHSDFADISELINKFKNEPGAPTKTAALLVGAGQRGLVDPRPELSYSHIAVDVDAFRGLPYPHKPGKCSNISTRSCISDEDCFEGADQPAGECVLCGNVSGGACCHGDGTCDIVPASACNGPQDIFKGEGTPCSRCCGPSVGCKALTNMEWLDAQLLWPNLDRRDVCKEEEALPTYNCVAWTVDSTERSIWDELDLDLDGLWEASEFEAFYAQHQKSAIIYGGGTSAVLHTSKPLPNNCASSKAGEWIRLRHDRNQIEGGYYGNIIATYAY